MVKRIVAAMAVLYCRLRVVLLNVTNSRSSTDRLNFLQKVQKIWQKRQSNKCFFATSKFAVNICDMLCHIDQQSSHMRQK